MLDAAQSALQSMTANDNNKLGTSLKYVKTIKHEQ